MSVKNQIRIISAILYTLSIGSALLGAVLIQAHINPTVEVIAAILFASGMLSLVPFMRGIDMIRAKFAEHLN